MKLPLLSRLLTMAGAVSLLCGISMTAIAAGPQVVSGPGADADCFKPWSADTKYFKWPKKMVPIASHWSMGSSEIRGVSR